MVRIQLHFHTE